MTSPTLSAAPRSAAWSASRSATWSSSPIGLRRATGSVAASCCCATWASSCASSASPNGVPGAGASPPITTLLPTANAAAPCSDACFAATGPVWMRAAETSAPTAADIRWATGPSSELPAPSSDSRPSRDLRWAVPPTGASAAAAISGSAAARSAGSCPVVSQVFTAARTRAPTSASSACAFAASFALGSQRRSSASPALAGWSWYFAKYLSIHGQPTAAPSFPSSCSTAVVIVPRRSGKNCEINI